MEWQNPQIIFFVFALPLLGWFFYWAYQRKRKMLLKFAEWELIQRMMQGASVERHIFKVGLLILVVALIIVSLARPQWGEVDRELSHKGLDIIVAIDVSNSMLATDIKPNRLTRASEQLTNLIDRLQGDRVAILTFAGDAFLACPLTVDYPLAHRILKTVDTSSIGRQGTMIGTAIDTSVKAFERSGSTGDKILILLTDGEDQGSEPKAAAQRAAEEGVMIYSIGIGSEQATPIEMPGNTGFKRDGDGITVSTRLDFETLQRVALVTGGKAIKSSPSGFLEIDQIISDIKSMRRDHLKSKTYTLLEERFQLVLFPAIFLLIIEMFIGTRSRVDQEWKGRFQS